MTTACAATSRHAGDVQPRQSWRKFIVLNTLSAPPDPDLPVTFATYGARCYGATFKDAWAVYGALVKSTHRIGARLKDSGLGIYQSLVTGGGSEEKDPDTKQPYVTASISLIATTRVVAE